MARYSLSREHRLTRRPNFRACYETGRRYFSRYFVLFVRWRTEAGAVWRLGLAVTRKTGNAVARNRVKRVVREFFRLHAPDMPQGCDVVAVPKRHLDPSGITLDMVTGDLQPLVARLTPPRRSGSDGP